MVLTTLSRCNKTIFFRQGHKIYSYCDHMAITIINSDINLISRRLKYKVKYNITFYRLCMCIHIARSRSIGCIHNDMILVNSVCPWSTKLLFVHFKQTLVFDVYGYRFACSWFDKVSTFHVDSELVLFVYTTKITSQEYFILMEYKACQILWTSIASFTSHVETIF